MTPRLNLRRFAVAATLPLALCVAAGAQTTTPTPAQTGNMAALPPLAPPRPLMLPKIVDKTLANGLRLVVLEDHSRPTIAARLAIPAGSIRDGAKVGLADATASMLDNGTKSRNESQIADTVDGLGASLSANADADYLTVSASGLSPYTDTLIGLMADVTLNPIFPDQELARYKTRAQSGYASALANGGTVASAVLARTLYGAHPYGNFSAGTPKSLAGITRADIQAFHDTYFAPNGAVLFLVGDITPAQAEEKANQYFGGWAKKDLPALPPAPAVGTGTDKPRVIVVDRPGAAQTEIRVGTLTTGYSDPQRITANVASSVLGGGSFENRLTREIRVKRGLSYGAGSGFSRNKEAGVFDVSTFTKNETTGEVTQIILDEINKLRQAPPSAEELNERKTYLTGSFAVGVATPTGLLARLVPAVLYGTGPQDLSDYTGKVQSATPQDVTSVFSRLAPTQTVVVLVGDAKAVQPQVANIGPVTVIKQDELDLLSPTLTSAPQGQTGTTPATPASPADLAGGKALVDAVIKAHGGDALLNLKSLTLKGKGKLTTPPAQGSIEVPVDALTLTSVAPDKSRLEMKTGFGDITLGNPGGGQVGWLSALGQIQDQPAGVSGGLDPLSLIRSAVKNNYAIALLPDAAVKTTDGKALKGFSITDAKSKVTKVYVDDTNLVRRVEVESASQGGAVVLSVPAYRDTSGVKTPTGLLVTAGGQELFSLTFDSAEVNKPVEDSVFERPKA